MPQNQHLKVYGKIDKNVSKLLPFHWLWRQGQQPHKLLLQLGVVELQTGILEQSHDFGLDLLTHQAAQFKEEEALAFQQVSAVQLDALDHKPGAMDHLERLALRGADALPERQPGVQLAPGDLLAKTVQVKHAEQFLPAENWRFPQQKSFLRVD